MIHHIPKDFPAAATTALLAIAPLAPALDLHELQESCTLTLPDTVPSTPAPSGQEVEYLPPPPGDPGADSGWNHINTLAPPPDSGWLKRICGEIPIPPTQQGKTDDHGVLDPPTIPTTDADPIPVALPLLVMAALAACCGRP